MLSTVLSKVTVGVRGRRRAVGVFASLECSGVASSAPMVSNTGNWPLAKRALKRLVLGSFCFFFFTLSFFRAAFRRRFTFQVGTASICESEPVRQPSGRRLPCPLKVRMSLLK